jgi:hypothetical protein
MSEPLSRLSFSSQPTGNSDPVDTPENEEYIRNYNDISYLAMAPKKNSHQSDRICVGMNSDLICAYGAKSKLPLNTFLFNGHGSVSIHGDVRGILDERNMTPGMERKHAKLLSPKEVADLIKETMGGKSFSSVIFASCFIGMNKDYVQSIANYLGIPVWASTKKMAFKDDGRVYVADSKNDTYPENGQLGNTELGYLIEYKPNQLPNRFGVCYNQHLSECLPK